MQDFLSQHWAVAATLFNAVCAIAVSLGVALLRTKFQHIEEEQEYQNVRLGSLEGDVSNLKGEGIGTRGDIKNLSRNLDHYFKELKGQIERSEIRHENDLAELKSLVKAQA